VYFKAINRKKTVQKKAQENKGRQRKEKWGEREERQTKGERVRWNNDRISKKCNKLS